MLKAVLFDMDGLMFDTERLAVRALLETGEKFGYGEISKLVPLITGSSAVKTRQICLETMGEEFPFEEFMRYRQNLIDRHIEANGVPVKPGLRELLAYLRQNGLRTAVVTSTSRAHAVDYIEKAGVLPLFDTVVCGDMLKKSKPAPDIYLMAARALEEEPKRCMALEDSPNGVASAWAAGMKAVMVPDLIPFGAEQEKQVYACVPSLSDVVPLVEKLRGEKG